MDICMMCSALIYAGEGGGGGGGGGGVETTHFGNIIVCDRESVTMATYTY